MKLMKMIISAALCIALMGISITSAQIEVFTDVDHSYWGYEAIQWGVENSIFTGFKDGTFKPNKNVTEEEFIALLVRTFGITTSNKEDEHWSEPYYKVAYEHNLPVSYAGAVEINRQAVAEIIVATRGANFSGEGAVFIN